jgi:hypothetical protein
MRTLLRQIKRELEKANHCACLRGRASAEFGRTEVSANRKSRDLRRTMAFAFAFIVTAYARFSTNNLSRVMKNSLSVPLELLT